VNWKNWKESDKRESVNWKGECELEELEGE